MKKLFAIILAIAMIATLSISAMAAETGSITINGVGTESTYEVYKLLDLESYNHTSGAYSYKVNAAWTGFFATSEALTYVTIDQAGYVTWINGDDDSSVAAFAKLALAYAKTNGIDPVKSSTNDGDFVITTNPETGVTSGVFADLELGYYLVDSSMGALCGLTTTNPNASINAKNGAPTIDKQVMEDSTSQWADVNTADIGQTVNFRVTINVHAGAENYVMHDEMSDGLTFKQVTKVEHIVPGTASNTTLTEGVEYTVVKGEDADDVNCTFEVTFSKAFCDTLKTNDKIIVSYDAMLNRDAVIAGEGNPNTAWLGYGEGHLTAKDTTYTKTYGFDIVKTDSQNTLLDGAEFKIYDALTGGNEIAVVMMDDNVTYRRARTDEPGIPINVENGTVRLVGFDNGTYYLEETAAPAGYNKLTARKEFTISDGNLDAIFNGEIYSTGSGVHVVNKTGSMLPETGGFGTTLFIIIGTLAVLGTGVLLVTKRRMAGME